jgi:hypothetical protein
MDRATLELLAVTVLSLANILLLIYQTLKKVPSEVRKMDAERVESITEAAESNMQGAQISNELLLARIHELKKDKRDAWNYIAVLKRKMIEQEIPVPRFVPSESDPHIKVKHENA